PLGLALGQLLLVFLCLMDVAQRSGHSHEPALLVPDGMSARAIPTMLTGLRAQAVFHVIGPAMLNMFVERLKHTFSIVEMQRRGPTFKDVREFVVLVPKQLLESW